MLLLSDEVIRQELTMGLVIDLVELAFAADARGGAILFPAIVEHVGVAKAHFGIKSGYLRLQGAQNQDGNVSDDANRGQEVLGLKAGGYWGDNYERYGLPRHRATILLINPDNGEALALMSANAITRMRTAAAGAIAAKYLAKNGAAFVTVLGTGEQANAQLEALQLVRDIAKINVWGRTEAAVNKYVTQWRARGIDTHAVSALPEALAQSNLVVTTTPASTPLVWDPWITPGTHINAVGSDGAGKRELDPELVKRSKFVADNISQSLTIGELQFAAHSPVEARKMIYAELGEICAGLKAGREGASEITIFDSSGVSFQDLIVANFLVGQAKKKKFGQIV
jgi:alanine dehydrogenase